MLFVCKHRLQYEHIQCFYALLEERINRPASIKGQYYLILPQATPVYKEIGCPQEFWPATATLINHLLGRT